MNARDRDLVQKIENLVQRLFQDEFISVEKLHSDLGLSKEQRELLDFWAKTLEAYYSLNHASYLLSIDQVKQLSCSIDQPLLKDQIEYLQKRESRLANV